MVGQASHVFRLPHLVKEARCKAQEIGAWQRRGFSSVGRASDLHSEGQEFESPSLQNAVIAQLVRARH
jgi:hypothetical protein